MILSFFIVSKYLKTIKLTEKFDKNNLISDFKKDTLDNQKALLLKLLDLNQLYVNLSSLHDPEFECTEEEKKVTKDFYQIKQ